MKKAIEMYDSLDAPIYVWDKVHSTSDLSWLLVKRKKLTKALGKKLQAVWEKIYDEYLKEFGFSESFVSIMQKRIDIAQMRLEMIVTGDRTLETFIEIEGFELEEMEKSAGKADFMQTKIAIESHFKFQVNMKSTSIREFYSYRENIK